MEFSSSSSINPPQLLLTSGASGRVNALISLRALKSLVLLLKAFILLLIVPFHVFIKRFISTSSSSSSSSVGGGAAVVVAADEKHHHQEKESNRRKSYYVRVPAAMVPLQRRSSNVKEASSLMVVSGGGDSDVATRRALSIKRVNLGNDEDNGVSIREASLFLTSRGETLFTQSWTPVSNQIRGLVVLMHGLNEHSGRYNDFAKKLNANGFKVYGMDWSGHGGSDGLHGYVHSLDYPVNDLKAFLEKVLTENPGLPCFCCGHSTGGAIILKAMLDTKTKTLVAGMVLTSPAVRVQPSHPIFGILAPIFSFLLPKYQFSAANKNGTCVSRDPAALLAKYSDPLVYTGSIRVRTGSEILRISSYLQQHLTRLTTPFLVLHGGDDTVTDPEASVELYERASASDKSIKLYDGLLHDILFEPEKEIVAQDIIDWLNSRVKVYNLE